MYFSSRASEVIPQNLHSKDLILRSLYSYCTSTIDSLLVIFISHCLEEKLHKTKLMHNETTETCFKRPIYFYHHH